MKVRPVIGKAAAIAAAAAVILVLPSASWGDASSAAEKPARGGG